jgi:phosphatidyl-myo-inositol alpha-mannosyltransferase
MARAAANFGAAVHIVGPAEPSETSRAASSLGLDYTAVGGRRPASYPQTRRAISRLGSEWTWCVGPYPGLTGAGTGAPTVLHLHQRPAARHRQLVWALRRAAAHTVVPSHSMRRALPGSEVLWNWTGEPSSGARRRQGDGVLRVGFLGRLSPIKGVTVLARAVQTLLEESPDSVSLVLAGDARLVPQRLQREVENALAPIRSRCELLGWVPPEELYGRVSVLAVPSICEESFGLVAAEALSEGVPLLVSDAGALPEIVGDEHPWVARRGDADDLARVLREFRSAPDVVDRSVSAAHRRWQELFSPAAGERRFCELLGELAR